jgi:gas vesicle protein
MEHEEGDYGTGSGSWILAFIFGGLIGAVAGLLAAPKSGRETREQLKDMADDAKEKAETYYEQTRSRMSDAVGKGADVFHQKKSKTESTAQETKGTQESMMNE